MPWALQATSEHLDNGNDDLILRRARCQRYTNIQESVAGSYRLTFDNSGDRIEFSGLELQRDGLDNPPTSELLIFEAV